MVKLVNLFFDINNLTIYLRLTILQVGFQNAKNVTRYLNYNMVNLSYNHFTTITRIM
jgi:hypothetical protein